MAYDAVINRKELEEAMKATADAIRSKSENTSQIEWKKNNGFADAINNSVFANEPDIKIYKGIINETILGSGEYVVLAQDDILAENRKNPDLLVRVVFDVEKIEYTVVETIAVNELSSSPLGIYQRTLRYGGDASPSVSSISVPINSDSPESVGCVQITEEGELRCYSNSEKNYAIRPSSYKVYVMW